MEFIFMQNNQDEQCAFMLKSRKVGADGNIVNRRIFGGNGSDHIYHLIPLPEAKFLAAGTSSSLDGDITGSHGGYEAWVFTVEY